MNKQLYPNLHRAGGVNLCPEPDLALSASLVLCFPTLIPDSKHCVLRTVMIFTWITICMMSPVAVQCTTRTAVPRLP